MLYSVGKVYQTLNAAGIVWNTDGGIVSNTDSGTADTNVGTNAIVSSA